MTSRDLLQALEKHGVVCESFHGQLSLRPRTRWEALPEHVRRIAAAHRKELLDLITNGRDVVLDVWKARLELLALGFVQIPDLTGKGTAVWSHVRGDAYGDQVLLGLITPTDADEEKFYSKDAQVRV